MLGNNSGIPLTLMAGTVNRVSRHSYPCCSHLHRA